MKSLRVALLAIMSMLAAVMVQAQTVDEIISKHIEAIGGKEKLSSIKTIYTEYDMDAMGNAATGVISLVNGKGFRNEIDFGGQKIVEVSTETGGWTMNPMMGQTSPTAMPADQVKYGKMRIWAGGPLFDYAAKGYKVELAGKENVGSVSAHKIKLVSGDDAEMTFLIDPTTYYILKATSKIDLNGQAMEIVYTYTNHEKNDFGMVMAKTTELALPGYTLNLTTKKTEVNKEIDTKIFDMQ